MSLPLIGLPFSVPLPLPYCDCRLVAMLLSSVAAPGVVGAGRTMPLRRMSSLRLVSELEARDVGEFGGLERVFDALLGADRVDLARPARRCPR